MQMTLQLNDEIAAKRKRCLDRLIASFMEGMNDCLPITGWLYAEDIAACFARLFYNRDRLMIANTMEQLDKLEKEMALDDDMYNWRGTDDETPQEKK